MKAITPRLLLLALCAAPCVGARLARISNRNIYGYVKTPGNAASDIKEIKIYDETSGFVHWADGIDWYAPAQRIRWYKNNLPTNHAYHAEVTLAHDWGTKKSTPSFYLPSSPINDQKVVDVNFDLNGN